MNLEIKRHLCAISNNYSVSELSCVLIQTNIKSNLEAMGKCKHWIFNDIMELLVLLRSDNDVIILFLRKRVHIFRNV